MQEATARSELPADVPSVNRSALARPQDRANTAAAAELTVVVPTFNERENVRPLIERLDAVLVGIAWEVVFVDDNSPDGTFALVKEIARSDSRVRCLRRVGRRGLAGACIEGMLASHASYVAAIDGDLQHDETLLPKMLEELQCERADIVIGSRYLESASGDGQSKMRFAASRIANASARWFLRIPSTDPMSGFFMCRRELIEAIAPKLSTQGFKILADILATTRGKLRLHELPYIFRTRQDGASKLDARVALDFAELLAAKATAGLVPPRFVSFLLVGASGVLVHLVALKAALSLGLGFLPAQSFATLVAMTSNFLLNNSLTYRDQRLKGWPAMRGLLWFYVICSVGAVSNIGVAGWLYTNEPVWWLAGLLGSLISVVWNFTLSSLLVWRPPR